jgi:myosin-1
VGKAPFHASKREDIYKKLQQREYKWPEVSKTQNDISTDLKDLVSSLLVHEDDRPGPDEIVSHSFFKTKFIPDCLDSSCVSKKPHWPNIRPPNAETLQRGFSESWAKLCKESGVGIYAPGKIYPLGGAKRIVSVVKDCEKEIAAGRAPVVPIPKDRVYLPFPERINILGKVTCSSEIAEEQVSSEESPQLAEISANERTKKASQVPKPSSRRLKENAEPMQAVVQEHPNPTPTMKRKNSSRKKQEEAKESSSRQPSGERSYKQRAIPTRQTSQEQPVETKPMISRQPSRRERPAPAPTTARPTVAARSRQASTVKQPTLPRTYSAPVLDAPRRTRTLRAVSASEEPIPEEKAPEVMVVIPDDAEPSLEIVDIIPSFTDPNVVLARVAKLRDNIASALSGKSSVRERSAAPQTLPFVSKWVDYAKKHGVGYVMEDGSIGCLFNATSRHPVTHAVVRHGYAHLQKAGKDLEAVGQVPLEYYAHRAGDELRRTEVEGDRKRTTGILWAKFGRYMCQQLGQHEIQRALAGDDFTGQTVFVRYYQRLGTVGVWGFSNGCFQVCLSQPLESTTYTNRKL